MQIGPEKAFKATQHSCMIKTLNLGIRKLSKFNCITSTAAITNYHKLGNLKQNYYLITIK